MCLVVSLWFSTELSSAIGICEKHQTPIWKWTMWTRGCSSSFATTFQWPAKRSNSAPRLETRDLFPGTDSLTNKRRWFVSILDPCRVSNVDWPNSRIVLTAQKKVAGSCLMNRSSLISPRALSLPNMTLVVHFNRYWGSTFSILLERYLHRIGYWWDPEAGFTGLLHQISSFPPRFPHIQWDAVLM